MSRRNKPKSGNNKSAASSILLHQSPPPLAIESNESHRKFLIRSLDRNDVEIGALIKLHRSIVQVRQNILDSSSSNGEYILLNMGKLRVDNDISNNQEILASNDADLLDKIKSITGLEQMCIDFLLRIKLRRQLMNRLIRRLMRVSAIMDGTYMNDPPIPPRYGESRLKLDSQVVNDHFEKAKQRDKVLEQVAIYNELEDSISPTATSDEQQLPKPDYNILKEFNEAYERVYDPTSSHYSFPNVPKNAKADSPVIGIGATQTRMTAAEFHAETQRWKAAILERVPDQPTFAQLQQNDPDITHGVYFYKERLAKIKANTKKAIETTTEKKDVEMKDAQEEKSEDVEMVKAEEGTDEKDATVANAKTESTTADADDDAMQEDTEPSAENTGKSVKFDLEDKVEPTVTVSSSKNEDTPSESNTDGSSKSILKSTDKSDTSESGEAVNDELDEGQEKIPFKKRAISLKVVPSFHDQDLKRIRTVHADLLSASMQAFARHRLDEVTREYNQALRTSDECVDRRQKFQMQYNTISYEGRTLQERLKSEYAVKFSLAKDQWIQRKREYERQRLDKCLPSRWGHLPEGTQYTRAYASRRDQVSNPVAACLSDIVDAVDMAYNGQLKIDKFPESFNPPSITILQGGVVDQNTGETLLQRNERLEKKMQQELMNIVQRLRNSEEDRQKAWRKMLKAKAEFEVPHFVKNAAGQKVRLALDMNNYHMVQMPPLRQGTMPPSQPIVHETPNNIRHAAINPNIVSSAKKLQKRQTSAPKNNRVKPSSSPAAAADNASQTGNESKYSLARVKERILADGTVAPVTLPKRGPDGLFARPAGRTRKGMEWDSMRGIWVPSGR